MDSSGTIRSFLALSTVEISWFLWKQDVSGNPNLRGHPWTDFHDFYKHVEMTTESLQSSWRVIPISLEKIRQTIPYWSWIGYYGLWPSPPGLPLIQFTTASPLVSSSYHCRVYSFPQNAVAGVITVRYEQIVMKYSKASTKPKWPVKVENPEFHGRIFGWHVMELLFCHERNSFKCV